ncbi:hypothetical protein AVEN_107646-1 [Araneus ventricosus]|uniref:Uncharacterized protein n=1 Tax=Araneus ventricosus TaxID=182803 RepID=A0A4Y2UMR6_ARAVE|nr:hypothetical protein AVEN_107643-1 [Araneus ventricosus]GBO13963.1 hypothetical protein AVEN_107646-1 [Araneus ventricosus]
MGPFLPMIKLCLSLLNRIGARRKPCISLAPCVSTRGQMAVNFKRRPSGMTQSGKALSALFSGRSLLATWEARSLFPWENLRVLFRTSQALYVRFSLQQAKSYVKDLQWNRVSSLEPSGPEVGILPLGHRGPIVML